MGKVYVLDFDIAPPESKEHSACLIFEILPGKRLRLISSWIQMPASRWAKVQDRGGHRVLRR
jgi:hypothetical protein